MKTSSLISFAVIIYALQLIQATAQLSWSVQPYDINAIYFLQSNTSVGWACGNFGTILFTADGGDTWTAQKAETKSDFACIGFADDKIGTIVGRGGIIFGTNDGGKTWNQRLSPTNRNLTGIRYIPGQNVRGFIVGQNGSILTTTDSGISWFAAATPTTENLSDISPLSPSLTLAVGQNGIILRSTDAGATWQSLISPTTYDLCGVFVLSAQAAWIVGDSGFVAKTTNGGNSWITQNSGIFSKINSVHFSGTSVGWAAGNGGMILKTIDAGTNWISVNDSNRALGLDNDDLTRIFAGGSQNTHKAWVSGKSGLLLATRNGGFDWLRLAEKPRGMLTGVYFSDNSQNGWISSTFGNIYATSSGGSIWQRQKTNVPVNLNSIQFINDRRGCAVGDVGTALVSTNAGATWTLGSTGTTDHLRSLTFLPTNPMNGWSAGVDGQILMTNDGGANWRKTSNPNFKALNSIHFADPQFGCAVGALGEVLTSFNGGTSWTPQNSGTNQELKSVCLTNWTTGWAVGSNSTMLQTKNSGSNWSNVSFLTPARSLNAVKFTDILNGWIVGAQGTILSTYDAGFSWKQHLNITTENLVAISFANARSGWIVGTNGIILHIEDHTDYLVWPANGQMEIDTRPTFRWLKHSGSNGYKVSLSTSPQAFTTGSASDVISILTSNENDTTATPASLLLPETVYYWTVDERATGFRLGIRSFRTSVAPVRVRPLAEKISVCTGKDTSLQVITTAGKTPLTYKWQLTNGKPIPADEIISVSDDVLRLKPLDNRTILCVVTDANNHSDSAIFIVTIDVVQPSIIKSQEFLCYGSAIRLSTTTKFAKYTWLRNQIPVGNDSVYSVVESGKYSVEVRNQNGCEGISEELSLAEQAIPLPIIEGTDVVCVNQKNVAYRAASFSMGRSYHWSIDSGASRASITSGENLSTVTVNFGEKGIVVLRMREIFNATQCFADTTFRISVDEKGVRPEIVSRSGVFALCNGASDTLEAPTGFAKYQWKRNNQDILGEKSSIYIVTQEGDYSVFVEDIGGCKGVSEQKTYRKGVNPTPLIIGKSIACVGAKEVVYEVANPQTKNTYKWSINGGALMSGASDSASVAVTFISPGAATIYVREFSPSGCIGDTSLTINISDSLHPLIAGNFRFCDGQSAMLDAGEGDSYRWYRNGKELQTMVKRMLQATESGNYQAVVFANNCSGTSNLVSVEKLSRPDSIYYEDNRTGMLTGPAAQSWQWFSGFPPDTIRLYGQTARTFTPPSIGLYSVLATSESGCTALVNIRSGGIGYLGEFAIRKLSSPDSIVSIQAHQTALLELRQVTLDSAKSASLGIVQFRLKVLWDSRLLNGVFPAIPPKSNNNTNSWEFIVPISRAAAFLQRMSFNQAGTNDSQAVVSLEVQAEDEYGTSPRANIEGYQAVVKFSDYNLPSQNDSDSLSVTDIFPNPANSGAQCTIHGKVGDVLEVYLTDNTGKNIIVLGTVKIPLNGSVILQFATKEIAIGQYYITVRKNNKTSAGLLQINR